MLEAGLKNTRTITVTEDLTAVKVGSGMLPVYATPAMIALMENTCASMCVPCLPETEGTDGVSLDVKHIAATPVGMQVRCEAELKEVSGHKLIFEVRAFDEKGMIGTGIHKRAIINNEAFMARLS
jgi:predicted thioesterase